MPPSPEIEQYQMIAKVSFHAEPRREDWWSFETRGSSLCHSVSCVHQMSKIPNHPQQEPVPMISLVTLFVGVFMEKLPFFSLGI